MLPVGSWDIATNVYDGTYSTNVKASVVSVQVTQASSSSTLEKLVAHIAASKLRYMNTKDIVTAIQHLGIAKLYFPSDTSTSEGFAFAEATIAYANLVWTSGNWVTDQTESDTFGASLVSTLVGSVYQHTTAHAGQIFDVVADVSRDLYHDPSLCYREAVSVALYAAVDGVLTSLNHSASYSEVVSGRYDETHMYLRKCLYTQLSCVKNPFTFSGQSLDIMVGKSTYSQVNGASSFCDYTAVDLGRFNPTVADGSCVEYVCKKAEPLAAIIPTSAPALKFDVFNGMGTGSASLNFFDHAAEFSVNGANISGYIEDPWFSSRFNLSDYLSGLSGGIIRPVIAFVRNLETSNYSTATIDTKNIALTKVEGDKYYFDAYSTGTIAVFAADFPWVCPGFENCEGYCPGHPEFEIWVIDCSGNCAKEGSLSYTRNDLCGVCGGSNDCVDCAGVVNGNSIIDVCGNCKLPELDAQCFVIAGAEPSVIKNMRGSVLSLFGAGFTAETVVQMNGRTLSPSEIVVNGWDILTITLADQIVPTADTGTIEIVAINGAEVSNATAVYYDPATSIISSIAPTKVFTNESNSITIQGTNLLSTVISAACVFTIESSGLHFVEHLDISASRNNGTCQVTFSASGDVSLNVLYSLPKYPTARYSSILDVYRPEFFVQIAYGNLRIKVLEQAPVAQSASFDATGAGILVDFDKPFALLLDRELFLDSGSLGANDFSMEVTCSTMFENTDEQLWRGESETDCKLSKQSPTRVKLTFSGVFTLDANASPIIPGKPLTFLPNTVVAAGASIIYSGASMGSLIVAEPNPKPQTFVVATAPSLIGSCSDYEINLASSYGSAGRSWKSVEVILKASNIDSGSVGPINDTLIAQSSQIASGESSLITVLKALLPEGDYVFAITFANFLGGLSTRVLRLRKLDRNDIPFVVVTGDNGMTELDVSTAQVLRASNIPDTECGQAQASVEYVWSFESSTTGEIVTFEDSEILQRASLVIEPYTLSPNSGYEFKVVARFNTSVNEYSFYATIATSTDVIFSSAGPSSTVGTENPIILSAVIQNSAYNPLDYSIFSCTWTCFQMPTEAGCLSASSGLPISIPNCFDNNLTGQLSVGTYKFSISVVNTETRASDIGDLAYLAVEDGILPLVSVSSSELSPGAYSTKFSLQAIVQEQTVSDLSNVEYFWTSSESCFGQSYLSLALQKDVTTLTDSTSANLKFIPGALSPGATYCFQVTVTDQTKPNQPGISQAIVKVRDMPFGGKCSADVTQGIAFNTRFTFKCDGWVTDTSSYPLNYIFLIRESETEDWSLLRPRSLSSILSTNLPSGTYQILPQVTDAFDSVSANEEIIEIVVLPAPLERRSLLEGLFDRIIVKRSVSSECAAGAEFVRNSYESFSMSKNVEPLIVDLAAAVKGIPLENGTRIDIADPQCQILQDSILKCLEDLVFGGEWYIDQVKTAPFAASLFDGVNKGNHQTQNTKALSLFRLLKSITKQLSSNSPQTCYNEPAALGFLSSFSTVLLSASNLGSNEQEIIDEWNDALASVSDCMIRKQICGQSAFSYSKDSLSLSFGLQDYFSSSSYCGSFTVHRFGTTLSLSDLRCLRFQCLSHPSSGLLPVQSYLSRDSVNYDLSTISKLEFVAPNGSVVQLEEFRMSGEIPIEDSFQADYGLENYNPRDTENAYVIVPAMIQYPDSTNASQSSYSTSSISIIDDTSDNKVRFLANNSGSFLFVVQRNIGQNVSIVSADPDFTQEDIGEIVPNKEDSQKLASSGSYSAAVIGGAVAGAVVGLLAIASVIYFLRKDRDKKESRKVHPGPNQYTSIQMPVNSTANYSDAMIPSAKMVLADFEEEFETQENNLGVVVFGDAYADIDGDSDLQADPQVQAAEDETEPEKLPDEPTYDDNEPDIDATGDYGFEEVPKALLYPEPERENPYDEDYGVGPWFNNGDGHDALNDEDYFDDDSYEEIDEPYAQESQEFFEAEEEFL
ncbi:MAG: hypothetical protein SGCHY_004272 [Lobulomycetales sp.]